MRAGYLIASGSSADGSSTRPTEAVLKTFMEATQQGLRQVKDCRVTAHLLTPGPVVGDDGPAGRSAGTTACASTSEQVVEFMLDALDWGDFHIRPRRGAQETAYDPGDCPSPVFGNGWTLASPSG